MMEWYVVVISVCALLLLKVRRLQLAGKITGESSNLTAIVAIVVTIVVAIAEVIREMNVASNAEIAVVAVQMIVAVDPSPGKNVHAAREGRSCRAPQHENLVRLAHIAHDDDRCGRTNRLHRVFRHLCLPPEKTDL